MTNDPYQVGAGATYCIFTDAKAGTIVARTPKTLLWQQDSAELLNGPNSDADDALKFSPGGFVGHTSGKQRYAYQRDENGQVLKFTLRTLKSGKKIWKLKGHGTRSRGCSLIDGRHEHYDYNF